MTTDLWLTRKILVSMAVGLDVAVIGSDGRDPIGRDR